MVSNNTQAVVFKQCSAGTKGTNCATTHMNHWCKTGWIHSFMLFRPILTLSYNVIPGMVFCCYSVLCFQICSSIYFGWDGWLFKLPFSYSQPKGVWTFYAYYFNGWLDICISKQLNRCTSWRGQWVYFKVHSPWIKHACCNHSVFVHASTLKNPVSGHTRQHIDEHKLSFHGKRNWNQQNQNRRNQKDNTVSKIG